MAGAVLIADCGHQCHWKAAGRPQGGQEKLLGRVMDCLPGNIESRFLGHQEVIGEDVLAVAMEGAEPWPTWVAAELENVAAPAGVRIDLLPIDVATVDDRLQFLPFTAADRRTTSG